MVARCSKYDFRNLGIIWDRNMWSEFFWSKNFRRKKIRKLLVENFLGPTFFDFWSKKNSLKQSMKIQNIEIEKKSKFRNFELSLTFRWFFSRFFCLEKIFFELFQDFFRFWKVLFYFWKNILKSKICSGIQKSYLENRASILKSFKIKNPLFFTNFYWFWWYFVQCYVYLPSTQSPIQSTHFRSPRGLKNYRASKKLPGNERFSKSKYC